MSHAIHPLPTFEWVLSAQAEKKNEAVSPIVAWRQLRAPLLATIDAATTTLSEAVLNDAPIDVYTAAAAAKKAAIAADKEFYRQHPCPSRQTQWRHFSPHDPLVIAIFGGSK